MKFAKEIASSLWELDKLIEDKSKAKCYASITMLMKRPHFSRNWVLQEITLSPQGGVLHCGKEEIPWQDFADAVFLFEEIESATHRLPDLMKRAQFFNHIPPFW
jgi:hypothetical protein